jgi:hypothetical protein
MFLRKGIIPEGPNVDHLFMLGCALTVGRLEQEVALHDQDFFSSYLISYGSADFAGRVWKNLDRRLDVAHPSV